jgi:hypothetical protein
LSLDCDGFDGIIKEADKAGKVRSPGRRDVMEIGSNCQPLEPAGLVVEGTEHRLLKKNQLAIDASKRFN